MKMNFLILAAAALVPLVLGAVWYHPKVMGTAWQKSTGMSQDQVAKMNIPLIMGLGFVLNFLVAVSLNFMVIHQAHVYSMIMNAPGAMDPNSEVSLMVQNLISKYGQDFRTFKHGAFHGLLGALFLVLPVIATHAMYEQKNWKYVLINVGYWAISFSIMGGIICQFA